MQYNQHMKTCPFKNEECNAECALYISPDELNEFVLNRLASIGVLKREEGICSLKTSALSLNRYIFENSNVSKR